MDFQFPGGTSSLGESRSFPALGPRLPSGKFFHVASRRDSFLTTRFAVFVSRFPPSIHRPKCPTSSPRAMLISCEVAPCFLVWNSVPKPRSKKSHKMLIHLLVAVLVLHFIWFIVAALDVSSQDTGRTLPRRPYPFVSH